MHFCSSSSLQITAHMSSYLGKSTCATSSSILSMTQVVSNHDLLMKVEDLSSRFLQTPITSQMHFQNSKYDVQNEFILLMKFHSQFVATNSFFMSCLLCRSSCLQHSYPLVVDYFSWHEVFSSSSEYIDFFIASHN